jgi:hypothetical protein
MMPTVQGGPVLFTTRVRRPAFVVFYSSYRYANPGGVSTTHRISVFLYHSIWYNIDAFL